MKDMHQMLDKFADNQDVLEGFRRRELVAQIVTRIIMTDDGDQFEAIANRVYEWIYKEKA